MADDVLDLRIVEGPDFAIGRIVLGKHLGLKDMVCAIGKSRAYARQLRLDETSEFPSGRVPLFICPCGDLECGALTVALTATERHVTWSDFGREAPGTTINQDEILKRLGPFTFDRDAYRYALSAYT